MLEVVIMKWFYDLKIAHKLNTDFLIILIFIMGVSSFAIAQLAEVNESAADIARN